MVVLKLPVVLTCSPSTHKMLYKKANAIKKESSQKGQIRHKKINKRQTKQTILLSQGSNKVLENKGQVDKTIILLSQVSNLNLVSPW